MPALAAKDVRSGMHGVHAAQRVFQTIREAIEAGLATYAECGGLMYLARSLTWQDKTCKMVGVLPGDAVMYPRPQGRGYVRLKATTAMPWPHPAEAESEIAAHEFHYSALVNLQAPEAYAFDVLRGTGIDRRHDGYVYKNLLACYSHQRTTRSNRWTEHFLNFVAQCKLQRRSSDSTQHHSTIRR